MKIRSAVCPLPRPRRTAVPPLPANVIDGVDDRAPLGEIAEQLGLSAAEVARIRQVSGHVGCFEPLPIVGLRRAVPRQRPDPHRRAHLLPVRTASRPANASSGRRRRGRTGCRFSPTPPTLRFGADPPKPGSNQDWAVVRLATPVTVRGAVPAALRPGEPRACRSSSSARSPPVSKRRPGDADRAGLRRPPRAGLVVEHHLLPLRLRRQPRLLRRDEPQPGRRRAGLSRHDDLNRPVGRSEAARRALRRERREASPPRSAPTRRSSRRRGNLAGR